jgi:hypothetical protein
MLTSALNVSERSASRTAYCFLYVWFILAGGQCETQADDNSCHCQTVNELTDRQTGREIMRLGKDD